MLIETSGSTDRYIVLEDRGGDTHGPLAGVGTSLERVEVEGPNHRVPGPSSLTRPRPGSSRTPGSGL